MISHTPAVCQALFWRILIGMQLGTDSLWLACRISDRTPAGENCSKVADNLQTRTETQNESVQHTLARSVCGRFSTQ